MNENRERTVGNGNLKPFKPGQSGNPLGRPIGAKTGLRSRITRLLDKEASPNILKTLKAEGIELEDRDNAEVIAHVLCREAQKGNLQAIKLIAEYADEGDSDPLGRTFHTVVNINAVKNGKLEKKVLINGKPLEKGEEVEQRISELEKKGKRR
jgi:hypothetical protein